MQILGSGPPEFLKEYTSQKDFEEKVIDEYYLDSILENLVIYKGLGSIENEEYIGKGKKFNDKNNQNSGFKNYLLTISLFGRKFTMIKSIQDEESKWARVGDCSYGNAKEIK